MARCAPETLQKLNSVNGGRTMPAPSCRLIHRYSLHAIITCRTDFLDTKMFNLRSQNKKEPIDLQSDTPECHTSGEMRIVYGLGIYNPSLRAHSMLTCGF